MSCALIHHPHVLKPGDELRQDLELTQEVIGFGKQGLGKEDIEVGGRYGEVCAKVYNPVDGPVSRPFCWHQHWIIWSEGTVSPHIEV